jgi:preprotein translocase subunit SecG
MTLLLINGVRGRENLADLSKLTRTVYRCLVQVFPKRTPLVHELSIAVLDLTGGNESLQIERKWFHSPSPFTGDDSQSANYKPLTLRSFSGLFVITASVSASMLFLSIILSVYASRYSRARSSESQSTNGGSGDEEAAGPMQEDSALQNGTGNGSGPEVSIQVEMSSSQGVGRALQRSFKACNTTCTAD